MHVEIEIPDKYAEKLREIEEVEPTIQDQIEVEVLSQVLRLINDTQLINDEIVRTVTTNDRRH